ncbi:MAG TPA: hypothetical protein VL651_07955 [Bacteroidia bacterium]|nr:hypothetical protein [Bacteroidia bacterium]
MDVQTGFWWKVGHLFYRFFHLLEWTYQHLSPNKVFILAGFVCFTWWMLWQHKYNKKALTEGRK